MTRGTHSRWGWRGWVTLAVLGEALGGMPGAGAAPLPEGPVRGFNVPIVDRTTGRRKALVRGETARPAGQDTWEVSGVRLEYYSASDQTNLVVRTERCFYHLKAETLSSPAELKVATAANGLELQGIGFSWNAASGLLISNQVQGIIHPARFATESPGRLGVPGAAGSPRSGDPDRAIRVPGSRGDYILWQVSQSWLIALPSFDLCSSS